MKSYNLEIVKRNMLMTTELVKIMRLLKESDIEAIAFKGPTLSQSAYNDITLRQYSDLDILININDIKKVYKLLLSNDYTTEVEDKFLDNELFIETTSDIQFFHTKKNLLIEIHWKLFRNQFSNKLNHKEIWLNKQKVQIYNNYLNVFSNEILLIYLCMHGSKHKWERIEWIVDIDKTINQNPNLNWNYIIEQSILLESYTMLYLGLYLTNKLFNTPLSNKLDKVKLNSKLNIKLSKSIMSSFIILTENKTEIDKNLSTFKFHYALNSTLIQKIRFLIKRLFPIMNGDIMQINLPKRLFFLYYIIKPIRLLVKYVQKPFSLKS